MTLPDIRERFRKSRSSELQVELRRLGRTLDENFVALVGTSWSKPVLNRWFQKSQIHQPHANQTYIEIVLATAAAGLLGAGAVQSRASILITIQESGSDVVATATGSADLGGLT